MNTPYEWNLDNLYTSNDSTEFKSDFETFLKLIEELNTFTDTAFTDYVNKESKIDNYIKLVTEIAIYFKLGNYLSLKVSANTKDFNSIKLLDKFENATTNLTNPFASFTQYIKGIDNIEEVINSSNSLKEYSHFLTETKLNSKFALSNSEEIIVDKLKISGASSFEKLRDNTVSSMNIKMFIEEQETELTFSEIRNLAYYDCPNVRKTAYLAELDSYKHIDETVASCLNSIKSWAITETKMRGYKNILDRTLINSRMERKTFDALMTAIEESLPELQKFYQQKALLLGHKNGLPFYDLFASLGDVNYKFSYDDAKQAIVENFNNFNQEVGNFIENAFNKGWVDAFPRKNKRDGAFCSNIHQIKESRILSNFTGSFSDMSTLAHELGHAFHGECLKEEQYLNSDYPMPIAETASIFFETIIIDEYLKKSNDNEKITLLDNSITDSLQTLIDIYSRFIFEDSFINEREQGTLSTEEICTLMSNAQLKAYGIGLDKDYLHEYMWLAKPHYYSCDYNFYNFPYAFGMLFAKGIYNKYKESEDKQAFYIQYKELLKATGKQSLEDVALKMDFDITDKNFWKDSINFVIEEIELFISLTAKA